ncbi:MAG: Gfo/Idh/MocA family oxidoreductase [Cyclobacteriaceae bacterium]|nr:Gfo/Idh/MocA family oxidoreductase [Cyclobacteriaceae bacterium]
MDKQRRKFIRNSLMGSAALSMGPAFQTLGSEVKSIDSTEKVRIGVIGVRGVNWGNLNSALKRDDVECVAISDIDDNVIAGRLADFEKGHGGKPDVYKDYRKMLERKDIHAVLVGTPDHWHTLQTIHAMESGKDVYVEKPLANSIEECLALERAGNRFNQVVQVGQQQRSGQHWNDAADYLQSGALGRISNVKCFLNYGNSRKLEAVPDAEVPEGVDYKSWLGPAQLRPFNKARFHGSWRYFWDYGGGIMTDWGVHLIDMVLMFMKAERPESVMSTGGKFTFPDSAMETPENQIAVYNFSDFVMTWEHTMGIGYWPFEKHHGVVFYGENGMLLVDRSGWEVRANTEFSEEKGRNVFRAEPVPHQSNKGNDRDAHLSNFIDCIKSREKPVCDLSIGINTAINAHLGNIAYRLGRSVSWDEKSKSFGNDKAANALMKANYQNGYKLP